MMLRPRIQLALFTALLALLRSRIIVQFAHVLLSAVTPVC